MASRFRIGDTVLVPGPPREAIRLSTPDEVTRLGSDPLVKLIWRDWIPGDRAIWRKNKTSRNGARLEPITVLAVDGETVWVSIDRDPTEKRTVGVRWLE